MHFRETPCKQAAPVPQAFLLNRKYLGKLRPLTGTMGGIPEITSKSRSGGCPCDLSVQENEAGLLQEQGQPVPHNKTLYKKLKYVGSLRPSMWWYSVSVEPAPPPQLTCGSKAAARMRRCCVFSWQQ